MSPLANRPPIARKHRESAKKPTAATKPTNRAGRQATWTPARVRSTANAVRVTTSKARGRSDSVCPGLKWRLSMACRAIATSAWSIGHSELTRGRVSRTCASNAAEYAALMSASDCTSTRGRADDAQPWGIWSLCSRLIASQAVRKARSGASLFSVAKIARTRESRAKCGAVTTVERAMGTNAMEATLSPLTIRREGQFGGFLCHPRLTRPSCHEGARLQTHRAPTAPSRLTHSTSPFNVTREGRQPRRRGECWTRCQAAGPNVKSAGALLRVKSNTRADFSPD